MSEKPVKVKECLMEGIGVFALCWIGGMSCYNAKDPVGIALAHMLALGILIYVGAATSGNPLTIK
jgi:hypothetical protein